MAEVYSPILDTPGPTLVGNALNCVGLVTLFTEVICDVTAATLSGTMAFTCGIDQPATFPTGFPPGPTGQVIGASSGYAFNAGTVVLTITNPAVGRTSVVIRWATPPKWFVPTWTFTSGGGTVRVRCVAWGFGQNTTP